MSIISAGDTSGVDLPEISNSLRFDGSNDYLSRTFTAQSSATTKTLSLWFKRSKLGAQQYFFSNVLDGNNFGGVYINSSDKLCFYSVYTASVQVNKVSTQVLRDPSAWQHLVVQMDTTQATATDRVKFYLNGVQVTAFDTNFVPMAQNATVVAPFTLTNSTWVTLIGQAISANYLDGYVANVCLVDNAVKAPSDFAYTDPNGQWRSLSKTALQSVVNAGGTASFFLSFDNGTSTTTLGNDASSKGNNWTLNNMVRDGSVSDCWSYDTPTNNFAVFNTIDKYVGSTVSNGSLIQTATGGYRTNATIRVPASLKIYCEFGNSSAHNSNIGIGVGVSAESTPVGGVYNAANSYHLYASNAAYLINNSVVSSAIASYTNSANQIYQLAIDSVSGKVWVGQNNTWYDSSAGTTGNPTAGTNPTFTVDPTNFKIFGFIDSASSFSWDANFGQRPVASGQWYPDAGGYFRYAPPTGYKALSTKNLSTPSIVKSNEQFDVKLDTGANIKTTAEAVYPSNFFEWIKDRANSNNHQLVDIVRGSSAVLQSNTTAVETTYTAPSGTSVAWIWKAGGAAVSNTAGSITSQVSANPAAGFSIVTYTGTGVNATIGHGLGVEPKMVLVKQRTPSGTSWTVWNKSVFDTSAAGVVYLESTAAYTNVASAFNSTAPTSTVFSVGSGGGSSATNISTNTYVAYCFAEVPGFSKIDKYTGNGSTDGPFVWCGFRPKYVLIKRSDSTSDWSIYDAARDPYNVMPDILFPNLANAETGGYAMDFLASGFKLRSSTASNANTNGGTYIFMAFAEAPFKYANAR